ncbi:conjugal transfer protein TraI [Chitinophaga alhagiae]|uniref:conjugal transfer protein TraI n=1 Tax=Chitinophaga alhagiae TaxID=2203219 RepID=UPI000E5B8002|nr:conjugal transfer protein TraI [Chitinophaga alhagiae]
MKRKLLIAFVFAAVLIAAPTKDSYAIWPVIKAALKKVIRAMDLQIQRLQNRTIGLQNAQKVLENVMAKMRLEEIGQWTERQKALYQDYFNELWRIKSVIAYYRRISEVIERQQALVAEYQRAFAIIREDRHFSAAEVDGLYNLYSRILEESLDNVEDVLQVVNAFTVQMSDADRLKIIGTAADRMEGHVIALRRVTNRAAALSAQRARTVKEVNRIKSMYGIN